MEVHHHPHLEKKNFKEYFLEFLMIFLAVTMGFFAENIREHFSDRTKEKKYVESFIRNVEDDTSNMRHVINFDRKQLKGIDSMLMLSHLNMNIDSNRKSFYYFAIRYFYNSASFKSNNTTLEELKSTGDYRLIVKNHAADSLIKYGADINSIYSQGDYYIAYYKEILSELDEMTDMTLFTDTSFINLLLNRKKIEMPLPKLGGDADKLRTFFNKTFDIKIITYSYCENNLQPELENATRLISFLKKEYNLEN